jgi:hypothetical protein
MRGTHGFFFRCRKVQSTESSSAQPSQSAAPSPYPTGSTPTGFPSAFPAPSPQPYKQAFTPSGQNAFNNTNASLGPWPECVGTLRLLTNQQKVHSMMESE